MNRGGGQSPASAAQAVTEADILAYMAYYGGRTQNIEAQLNALIALVEDLRQ